MENWFWGYFASMKNLEEIATRYKLPFAHKKAAGTFMAYEVFYKLESYGPLRVMSARLNGEYGYVFVLGEDDVTLESIPERLKSGIEKMYNYPPRQFKFDSKIGRFRALWPGLEEDDILWRGGDLKSNLGPFPER
ncbi:hypothetical protein FRC06_008912 [Ceratobasidium sp. 370]|nr:hypothetical protein FRC06_008912 [Ceratobasidium sp. 370]